MNTTLDDHQAINLRHTISLVKRYKQTILSNFFVTTDELGVQHLVEANLDIESRGDLALCTEVLQGHLHFEVLTNRHLSKVCSICTAILRRRISNMPKEHIVTQQHSERVEMVSESQMSLLSEEKNTAKKWLLEEASGQLKLPF